MPEIRINSGFSLDKGLQILYKWIYQLLFRRVFNMNKTELVAAIAKNAELTKKDAEAALTAFTETVAAELKKGEKVQLVGFGTFEVSKRAACEGRNPQTGATMKIAACKAPKFKAGKALKDAVNK
jgi:DNA-binding protein HU-beta